ncbi:MAG TPA: hypothetical protein VLU43_00010 [Anaeromyxobacteraceae bacterium]|nr:hypothetical protein [Anaeromyxobacteraceae bacterium]
MPSTPRTDAQRAASRRNGARSTGPRTPEGRIRSSANRTTHGLNSVRLLLATEDAEEYRLHLTEWVQSLGPATAAEHQIVQLVADLMWRLKRVERIEQRRALAILGDLVEQTPEWAVRAHARDVVLGLDTVARMVASSPLPVPTTRAGAFLAGLRGVENLVEKFRTALAPELWPEAGVCAFLGAVKNLAQEIDTEASVSATFTATGTTAAALATAVRDLLPALDAAIDKARTAISTETLLVDDEDRRFERHRRIMEASVARQLDLLAKVRAVARPAASGSFERAPQVELRVIRG